MQPVPRTLGAGIHPSFDDSPSQGAMHNTHIHSFTTKGNLAASPTGLVCGDRRKPDNPEETHADMGTILYTYINPYS